MKLNPIKTNMTELELNNGNRILFSYQTPVAFVNMSDNKREFYKTDKKWSNATTRHINAWSVCYNGTKPQSFFDRLVA